MNRTFEYWRGLTYILLKKALEGNPEFVQGLALRLNAEEKADIDFIAGRIGAESRPGDWIPS